MVADFKVTHGRFYQVYNLCKEAHPAPFEGIHVSNDQQFVARPTLEPNVQDCRRCICIIG